MSEMDRDVNVQDNDRLSEEELNNIAGGGCHAGDGRLVVTDAYSCSHWQCVTCGGGFKSTTYGGMYMTNVPCGHHDYPICGSCGHCSKEGIYLLCNHSANKN